MSSPGRRPSRTSHGLDVVSHDALSIVVETSDAGLCVRDTLVGGQPEPVHRLGVVLRHTLPIAVEHADVELPLP